MTGEKNRGSAHDILVTWFGGSDIKRMQEILHPQQKGEKTPAPEAPGCNGPLRTFTDGRKAEKILILVSAEYEDHVSEIEQWVRRGTEVPMEFWHTGLGDPTDYEEVYQVTESFFRQYWDPAHASRYHYNLTPGSPAIQGIMLYMSQVRYSGGTAYRVVGPEHAKDGQQIFSIHLPFWVPTNALRELRQPYLELSPELQQVIEVYAPIKEVNILLLGESGVGKTSFAGLIHAKAGKKEDKGEFVVANCAELASGDGNMFRSALFGAMKGSFTGAQRDTPGLLDAARGGTLFFDEIGDIPLDKQAILLRVLQEKAYLPVGSTVTKKLEEVRIVAATNHDLQEEVKKGTFRADLFYRLAMCSVTLPALREIIRSDEKRFKVKVRELLQKAGKTITGEKVRFELTDEAWQLMRSYAWPGNVRELEHVILLACILAHARDSTVVEYSDVKTHLRSPAEAAPAAAVGETSQINPKEPGSWPENVFNWLEEQKAEYVKAAMQRADHRIGMAAKLLGIPYQTLRYYLKSQGKTGKDRGPEEKEE